MSSNPEKYGRLHEEKMYVEFFQKRSAGEVGEIASTKSVCSIIRKVSPQDLSEIEISEDCSCASW